MLKRYLIAVLSICLGGLLVFYARSRSSERVSLLETPAKVDPRPQFSAAEVAPAAPNRDGGALSPRVPAAARGSASIGAGLAELNRESSGPWTVTRGSFGYAAKLSNGSIFMGTRAPIAASERFLQKFGREVLGADLSDLVQTDSRAEVSTTQIIYQQKIGGLPVFGSRVSLFLDRDGNVVYVTAHTFPGEPPAGRAISSAAAAASVRQAVAQYFSAAGEELSEDAYPADFIAQRGQLGYRLSSSALGLVYRYELSLAEPLYGDYEIMVDARAGDVTMFRALSKK